MDIQLEKDGKQVSYKTGTALYILLTYIPLIGWFIMLFLTIVRKQFKGIILNQLLLSVIFSFVLSLVRLVFGAGAIFGIASSVLSIFVLIVFVIYVLNANYYSIKARLDEGYTVVNGDDEAVKLAVQRAVNIKLPFWQILSF